MLGFDNEENLKTLLIFKFFHILADLQQSCFDVCYPNTKTDQK